MLEGLSEEYLIDLHQRLLEKVGSVTPEGCWIWVGKRCGKGYGQLKIHGKRVYAHRVSYSIHNGPIPGGMVTRHGCDTPACINPSHLSVGTNADNVSDMIARGRQHYQGRAECSQGHVYDQVNTRFHGHHRRCRLCDSSRENAYRQAKRLRTPGPWVKC